MSLCRAKNEGGGRPRTQEDAEEYEKFWLRARRRRTGFAAPLFEGDFPLSPVDRRRGAGSGDPGTTGRSGSVPETHRIEPAFCCRHGEEVFAVRLSAP